MTLALRRFFDVVVLVLIAWQVYDLALAMSVRYTANFDLEWMEGATLITGLRAAEGRAFYTLPQADYIPFIYPPLYAWVLGALSHVAPLGYPLGRGVSIVCTIIATVALAWTARREGATWPVALGAAALFLGCYEEGGSFYDLVRIDALAMALTALALLFGRVASTRGAVAAGVLLAIAFSAKHNMALFGLPIALWRWRTRGLKDALLFVAASAGPALAFVIVMQVQTNGLFLTYLLGVPAEHGAVWTRGLPNLSKGRVEGAQAELVRALPVLVTAAALGLPLWIRTRAGAYWGAVALTAVVMVSIMRAHQGGYLNVLIPAFWVLPLLGVVLAVELQGRKGRLGAWSPVVVSAVLAAQLWEGRGDLRRYLPNDRERAAAGALVDELRSLPGPVLMPHGPWYPVLAGHAPSIALIALWDVDHTGGPLEREARVVDRAMRSHHWATIVSADDKLGHGLKEHYERSGTLKAPSFSTHTGWPVRFGSIWAPKASAAPEGSPDETSPDPGAG